MPRRSRPVPPSVAAWLAVAAALLVLSGCTEEEGVRTYTVPRESSPPPRVDADKGIQRVVGVIVPRDHETWFFKMMGSDKVLGDQVEAFEKFLATVRFPEGKPIEWTKPDDWGEKQGDKDRYATLLVGPQQQELKVSKFPPLQKEGQHTLLGNVNRWRNEVKLPPVTAAELDKVTKRIKVAGLDAVFVDATRPARADERPAGKGELKYKVPDDWKKAPNALKETRLTFTLSRDGKAVTASYSIMSPQDLRSNVGRWRGQVGLPPNVSDEELRKIVGTLELPLGKAEYVDLSGGKKRLLGVLLPQDQGTWVFKLFGDSDLVGSERSAFEAFVRSVRFE